MNLKPFPLEYQKGLEVANNAQRSKSHISRDLVEVIECKTPAEVDNDTLS